MEDGGFELRSGAEGAPSEEASATHCVGRYGAAAADVAAAIDASEWFQSAVLCLCLSCCQKVCVLSSPDFYVM